MIFTLTNSLLISTESIESIDKKNKVIHMVSGKEHVVTPVLLSSILQVFKNQDRQRTQPSV